MSDLLNRFLFWLSGSGGLDPADAGVRFDFAAGWPAWIWATIALAAAALGTAGYARIEAPRAAKAFLSVLRFTALMLLAAVIAGPRLIQENETTEPDWLVVLVDRSASLGVADAPGGATRDQQLRALLEENQPALARIAEDRRVLWMGFGPWAYELEAPADAIPSLGEAEARKTNLGRALEQSLAQLAARPVSGVLVLTDGRSADEVPAETMRRLTGELIPVFAVPLGDAQPGSDFAVTTVRAPAVAYGSDVVPVVARIEARGGAEDSGPETVTVELVDDATGRVITTQDVTLQPAEGGAPRTEDVTLTARTENAGERSWSVRVRGSSARADLVPANDQRSFGIELVDREIRVLYLDGYPRWEYRYVKNLLLREGSIDSSTLLLASARNYIQEGDTEVRSLPRSPEEWAEYDVVVLGDFRAELLSEDQLENLRSHISDRGAGLLWIAGEGATPHSWRSSPLGDLIPFRDTGDASAASYNEAVTIAPTPVADRFGLLGLASDTGGWPEDLSRPSAGWPALFWAQDIDPESVKPTAQVLATFTPASDGRAPGPSATPAVLSMQYGAGRIGYVATDETWRWRFGRGEPYTERFWVPLVRYLARERLSRSGRGAELVVSPSEPVVAEPAVVEIRLFDQSLLDAGPETLNVSVRPVGADAASAGTGSAELTLARSDDQGGFSSPWRGLAPGRYAFEPTDPLLAGLGLRTEVEVVLPDDELRRPQSDHARLVALAETTGGRILQPADLDTLAAQLPNRAVVIPAPPEIETLWDKAPVLALFLVLFGIEWIVRRLVRLS